MRRVIEIKLLPRQLQQIFLTEDLGANKPQANEYFVQSFQQLKKGFFLTWTVCLSTGIVQNFAWDYCICLEWVFKAKTVKRKESIIIFFFHWEVNYSFQLRYLEEHMKMLLARVFQSTDSKKQVMKNFWTKHYLLISN